MTNKHPKSNPKRKARRPAAPGTVAEAAPHDRVAAAGFPPPTPAPNEPLQRPSMTSEVAEGERDVGSVPHGSGRFDSVDR